MKKRFKPAPDFPGYLGPTGWEAQAHKVIDLSRHFVLENSMAEKMIHIAMRDAGVVLARTVIEHGSPSERIDAVENWLATVMRPRSNAHAVFRRAHPEFIATCNALAREIVKAKPNGK